LDICYTLEENNYMGNTTIQLMIKDIKAWNCNPLNIFPSLISFLVNEKSSDENIKRLLLIPIVHDFQEFNYLFF
jgi:hypothetical protein